MGAKTGRPRGRPKGAPNKVTADIREAAQVYTAEALEALVKVMRGTDTPPAAIVAASNSILDRAHGKPTQSVEMDANLNGEVSVIKLVPGGA